MTSFKTQNLWCLSIVILILQLKKLNLRVEVTGSRLVDEAWMVSFED